MAVYQINIPKSVAFLYTKGEKGQISVRVWRKGNHDWCGYRLVQPLWKSIWRALKKLEIDLTHDPTTPLLSIYLKDFIPYDNTCMFGFIAALFIRYRK